MHGSLVWGKVGNYLSNQRVCYLCRKRKVAKGKKQHRPLDEKWTALTLHQKELMQMVGAAYPLIHLCPFAPVCASIVSLSSCFISPVFNSPSVFSSLYSLGFFLALTRYLLVSQTKLPCIVTSRRCHFVVRLDIKKAESYYSVLETDCKPVCCPFDSLINICC